MEELRIGILGNVDSGKSTIISVLKEKILDNGRGLARTKILKHKHEKDSGRTSSITHHYYIDKTTHKILSFIDLAGHEKYYKTTMFGVNGCSLDYIIIMIGSNMGVTKMTTEHLTLALILKIPFIVVFSKIDICPENIFIQTFNAVKKVLTKFKIYNELQHIDSFENAHKYYSFKKQKQIPYFKISNVKGNNIDLLRSFLLNIDTIHNWDLLKMQKKLCTLEDIFFVKGVGIVVSGTMTSGTIVKGDKVMLGPFNGIFHEVLVKSIHDNFKQLIEKIHAGQSGCFSIKSMDKKFFLKRDKIKRGMVLLDTHHENHTYSEFEAKIKILHHPTTIKINYETTVHCGPVKQIAKIINIKSKNNEQRIKDGQEEIDNNYLRTGDSSIVKFRFKKKPEFIQKHKQIVFREGQTKGIGWITQLIK